MQKYKSTLTARQTELDEVALTDIRLALSLGQPFGNNRFSEALCLAVE